MSSSRTLKLLSPPPLTILLRILLLLLLFAPKLFLFFVFKVFSEKHQPWRRRNFAPKKAPPNYYYITSSERERDVRRRSFLLLSLCVFFFVFWERFREENFLTSVFLNFFWGGVFDCFSLQKKTRTDQKIMWPFDWFYDLFSPPWGCGRKTRRSCFWYVYVRSSFSSTAFSSPLFFLYRICKRLSSRRSLSLDRRGEMMINRLSFCVLTNNALLKTTGPRQCRKNDTHAHAERRTISAAPTDAIPNVRGVIDWTNQI